MPNHFFKFKQFTVFQDKCAMKVGTDGVLLGAWAEVKNARRILDIGTGTGLIALMLAQRSKAEISAVDIDKSAVAQAEENVSKSPWSTRITIIRQDIISFQDKEKFDVIVSNPPYFQEKTSCADRQRHLARHTDGLSFEQLLQAAERLLSADGLFFVVLPSSVAEQFIYTASSFSLYPVRQTWVCTKPDALPKRVLLALGRQAGICITQHLIIELSRHVYSQDYITLTQDYYLHM